mmetsp:Transcript_13049/g.24673  ORF Transcript_13049/g.24673 Transcript_13049/m.24673 type:complete len:167 (+) Transcript_13049:67-567(+)
MLFGGRVARQVSSSALGSFAAFCSYIGVCHYADDVLDPGRANALGLATAASVNFMLQRFSFAPGADLSGAMLRRYLVAEAIIVSVQQSFFLCLLPVRLHLASGMGISPEDPRLMATLRAASQASVFLAVSFPLRKHWVFAASQLPLHSRARSGSRAVKLSAKVLHK